MCFDLILAQQLLQTSSSESAKCPVSAASDDAPSAIHPSLANKKIEARPKTEILAPHQSHDCQAFQSLRSLPEPTHCKTKPAHNIVAAELAKMGCGQIIHFWKN
jgi:hypothetical protein